MWSKVVWVVLAGLLAMLGACAREVADAAGGQASQGSSYEEQWAQQCEQGPCTEPNQSNPAIPSHPCEELVECLAPGLVCESFFCVQPCDEDAECPTGWICEPLWSSNNPDGKYCGKSCEVQPFDPDALPPAVSECEGIPNSYCSDAFTEGADGGTNRPRCVPTFEQ